METARTLITAVALVAPLLAAAQTRVQNMENKAMAGGKVTNKQAGLIEHAQDNQSKKIERQKHYR